MDFLELILKDANEKIEDFKKERDDFIEKRNAFRKYMNDITESHREIYKREKALDIKLHDADTIRKTVRHFTEEHKNFRMTSTPSHLNFGAPTHHHVCVICMDCEKCKEESSVPLNIYYMHNFYRFPGPPVLHEDLIKRTNHEILKEELRRLRDRFTKYRLPSIAALLTVENR